MTVPDFFGYAEFCSYGFKMVSEKKTGHKDCSIFHVNIKLPTCLGWPMTNLTYHGVFSCLLLAAIEWPAISQHKVAAIFCLMAVIFYLFFLSASFYQVSNNNSTHDRKVRLIKRRQAKKAGMAMVLCSVLFVLSWMPYSESVQIIFICGSFFFLVFYLASLSFNHFHERTKKDLNFKK
jgi:hypothetical protein